MDFEHAWGQRTVNWIDLMVSTVSGDGALRKAMFRTIGYDEQTRQVAADGPILCLAGDKLATLAAGVLYAEQGIPWHAAEKIAVDSVWASYGDPLNPEEIHPVGDVAGTVRRLRDAGIRIAVATADNRDVSEQCLQILGIDRDVAVMACGDDPLPQKPDARLLPWIADQVGTEPAKMLMVGDTINDMLTGRNGGAAGCVGVGLNKHHGLSVLAPYADAVVSSIAELRVDGG
jgi:phosphoglycolate phosphatase-like HAD superfamily hydrolase